MSDTGIRQRLAAILAADVAGYSRLMAADDRATVAALDAARAVYKSRIESNQGRVIDMAGDSVLAVFETAIGAVSTALAVQQELKAQAADVPEDRRMRFRIGVHLGDVIEKADGSVYGDGVNIAARLEGLAEPGGVSVSDSVRSAVRGKVDASFEDQGEQAVKNIPEPVRVFRVRAEGAAEANPAAAAGAIDLSLPDKPSIAVLPFANMSGDPEQEYFTDGVTEDIITELSRFHSLFVIARNSSFSYKGKSPDIRQVGRELGVRYVLEGSIRKAANRIRVTGQLIDARTGHHLWAERYDRTLEDIFAVQEEVTQSIVTAIAPQIDAAERDNARRRRPENLSAYEIAVRANALVLEAYQRQDRSMLDDAIKRAKVALAIDPRSTLALGVLALAQWQHVLYRTAKDLDSAGREGMAASTKAIEIDPSDSRGYIEKALLLVYAMEGDRWDEALRDIRRAHQLNPNDVRALRMLGWIEAVAGNLEKGLEYLHQALRISPRDPNKYNTYHQLAQVYCLARDYANAIEYALFGASEAPNFMGFYQTLAMSYVGLGDMAKAMVALDKARRIAPEYIQSRLDGDVIYRQPEHRQRMTTFLRVAAGLEEPSAADAFR